MYQLSLSGDYTKAHPSSGRKCLRIQAQPRVTSSGCAESATAEGIETAESYLFWRARILECDGVHYINDAEVPKVISFFMRTAAALIPRASAALVGGTV